MELLNIAYMRVSLFFTVFVRYPIVTLKKFSFSHYYADNRFLELLV